MQSTSSQHGLDLHTQRLLQEEWERLPASMKPGRKRASQRDDMASLRESLSHELSPVIAVLPGMIRLVCECTDRPVEKFRSTIKRLILEQLFMEIGGDSIVDTHHLVQVKLYVELTVRVLIRVRQHDLGSRNEWADMPVTPQMFG